MIKSFEYIDPILAQKIHNLQSELKKVQQSRNEILNNTKLTSATREKLLKYQTECGKNIQKLLTEEKDKLAEYLDEQTNVITKKSRLTTSKAAIKPNAILNQSTRLDFQTTDDTKSLDVTKTEINRKVSSFYMASTERQPVVNYAKFPSKKSIKIRQLKKKVFNQSKLIKMLVTWIKIYYERQQSYKQTMDTGFYGQIQKLKKQNTDLRTKCRNLQQQILGIRRQYKSKATNLLQTQQKYDMLKNQNSGLKLQRKQLLNNAKSLKKSMQN